MQVHAKVIGGRFLKKYKLGFMANSFVSSHLMRKYRERKTLNFERRKRKDALTGAHGDSICKFFEEDINSSVAPGKKDKVKKNKICKQKRYLHDSLKKMHRKYLKCTGSFLSYTTFTRLKPFWVVKPNVRDRETCRCVKHANMTLMTDKLHLLKVIENQRDKEFCAQMCCTNSETLKKCMYRECSTCQEKDLFVTVMSQEKAKEETYYHQWSNKTEDRIDKKKQPLTVRIVSKSKITCTVEELINATRKQLPAYMKHVYKIEHQYDRLRYMKMHMSADEALILMDFSENYVTKYNDEIQSVHFGASKSQVTLHTGVLYYFPHNTTDKQLSSPQQDSLQCMSFCSISASFRHDPSSIWAHLLPVFEMMQVKLPTVNKVHFLSDGPTTQYRNKNNFFLLTYYSAEFGWKNSSWNFSEAGHGKSSAEGIGGVVKRSADQAVAHRCDITSADNLIRTLRDLDLKVNIFEIGISDIELIDNVIPKSLKSISNTMKLHQLVWDHIEPRSLGLRELSCTDCTLKQT